MWKLLARLRVPLGFAAGVVVLWLAAPTWRSLAAGVPIAVLGEALRIWAAGHLNKSREVTSSGPYRLFAHPLYVGSSLIGAGLATACASLAVVVLIALYLGATLTAAIKTEEAYLRRTFGDRYDSYRAKKGAASSSRVENVRRFTLAQARANREYRAVVGLLLAVLLLTWKATYNGSFWRTAGTHIVRPGG